MTSIKSILNDITSKRTSLTKKIQAAEGVIKAFKNAKASMYKPSLEAWKNFKLSINVSSEEFKKNNKDSKNKFVAIVAYMIKNGQTYSDAKDSWTKNMWFQSRRQVSIINRYKERDDNESLLKFGHVIKKQGKLSERLSGLVNNNRSFKMVGKFSNSSGPLKVYGELLRPGKYMTGVIDKLELKKAYDKLISENKQILMFTTHDAFWSKSTNLNDIAGKITGFNWDENLGAIKYEGEIYDTNAANKLYGGLASGVSAGFTFDLKNGNNIDIDIKEATITFKPHARHATLKLTK